ncbi:hypothetical protein MMC27_001764 [Xylographa pallens]|nr:hypothetical protein [Xylographa pallens]
MLRALLLLTLLSTTLPLAHPADTDDASGPLFRHVFIEFLVDKAKRVNVPPTPPATIGAATSLPLITMRLYLRNNPSPFANTRTDIGIPYIVNLHAISQTVPQNAVLLAPALMEHDHRSSPQSIAENQLGRMLDIEGTSKGLATFRLGTTQLTNEQILDPANGKGLLLDAVGDFEAAGGGGQMVLMQRIIDRLEARRPVLRTELMQQRQQLFDVNMAGYMERTAKYERVTRAVLGSRVPMISYEAPGMGGSGLERWGGVEEVDRAEQRHRAGQDQGAEGAEGTVVEGVVEGVEGVEAREGEEAEEAEEGEEGEEGVEAVGVVEGVEGLVIGEGEEEVGDIERVKRLNKCRWFRRDAAGNSCICSQIKPSSTVKDDAAIQAFGLSLLLGSDAGLQHVSG